MVTSSASAHSPNVGTGVACGGGTGGNAGLQASLADATVPIWPAVVLNWLAGGAGLIRLVTGFCGSAVAWHAVLPAVALGHNTGTVSVQVPGAVAVPAGI